MEFKGYFVGVLLTGLVAVAMIAFAINLQDANNAPNNLENSPYINNTYGNLTSVLTNSQGSSANASNTTLQGSPSVDSGGLMLTTIVSGSQLLASTPRLIYDITIGGLAGILGVSNIVIIVFNAIIVGVILLLLWSLYRLGR